ncbi:MAG: N-6 DNA methylase [Desulfobacterales bacterium]|nr:N-6 DNA methylase [Desulfobacterales bacterium]
MSNNNSNDESNETEVMEKAKRLKELFPQAFTGPKGKHLVTFDKDCNYITYTHFKKRRNFNNPEEFVQARSYLELICQYKYPVENIRIFVSVTMGRETKEADIIVYNDEGHLSPHIVVECKKPDVSELEFKQSVNQGFSYAVAEGAQYVWITSSIKNEYYKVPTKKPKAREIAPDIPSYGASGLAAYKYAKGGGEKDGQRLFELEIVKQDELTNKFKQAHQALWGGGELNPSEAFDELDKLIFCKIWDEKKPRKKGEPYDFQYFTPKFKDNEPAESKQKKELKAQKELLDRIKALYSEGKKKDPEVFKDNIRLSPSKAKTVVSYLEGVNLGDTDLDSKGRAFETFMGSFFRGDFGQYFTPRTIVNFIVDVLPIKHDSLVLDTSCGSGGFLLHALDKVRKQADQYEKIGSVRHYNYWHDFAQYNLYGIEINEQIARTAKMNMIIHDDGHTNVVACDGLLPDKLIKKGDEEINGIQEITGNKNFEYGKFDFIITNPPFGSAVKQTERAYMHHYKLAAKETDWLNPKSKRAERPSQSTEILFIEQCHKFLAEKGYLAIVIPDGVLTNSSLQYVRDNIEEMFRIVAVVSMPQTAFQHTGAGVKSSVLFLKKHTEDATNNIKEQKLGLQKAIKKDANFLDTLKKLEAEKKIRIKKLQGQFPDKLSKLDKESKELFEQQKKEISDDIKQQIDDLREELADEYLSKWQKLQEVDDYEILMAIAEDIGYDSTGNPTGNNEFDIIGKELARFISAIEEGKA